MAMSGKGIYYLTIYNLTIDLHEEMDRIGIRNNSSCVADIIAQ